MKRFCTKLPQTLALEEGKADDGKKSLLLEYVSLSLLVKDTLSATLKKMARDEASVTNKSTKKQ